MAASTAGGSPLAHQPCTCTGAARMPSCMWSIPSTTAAAKRPGTSRSAWRETCAHPLAWRSHRAQPAACTPAGRAAVSTGTRQPSLLGTATLPEHPGRAEAAAVGAGGEQAGAVRARGCRRGAARPVGPSRPAALEPRSMDRTPAAAARCPSHQCRRGARRRLRQRRLMWAPLAPPAPASSSWLQSRCSPSFHALHQPKL